MALAWATTPGPITTRLTSWRGPPLPSPHHLARRSRGRSLSPRSRLCPRRTRLARPPPGSLCLPHSGHRPRSRVRTHPTPGIMRPASARPAGLSSGTEPAPQWQAVAPDKLLQAYQVGMRPPSIAKSASATFAARYGGSAGRRRAEPQRTCWRSSSAATVAPSSLQLFSNFARPSRSRCSVTSAKSIPAAAS
jgi:hypothetical protein